MKKPAISTIELSKACNFSCSYCQRHNDDLTRKSGFMPLEFIASMIENGDFENTFYLELQGDGESTLHPQFNQIVAMLKPHVPYLGISTNASFMEWKHNPIFGVQMLDAVTISVHPESNQDDICDVVGMLMESGTRIRLQTIGGNWHNLDREYWEIIQRQVHIFMIDDYPLREWGVEYATHVFCSDLKASVTVFWNGDVVRCCNDYSGKNSLGNLKSATLEEIWSNFDHQFMDYCSTCATPSPYTRRLNFFTNQMEK